MKSMMFAFALFASLSAHAISVDCMVTAVLDGAIPLAQGQSVTITDSGAIIGSTIYRNAKIVEHTSGSRSAVRVIDRDTTIEVISDSHTKDGELYVTAGSGSTTKVALLNCR
jgi:hypothetical protein